MIYAKTCCHCKVQTHAVVKVVDKWGTANWACENRIDCYRRAKKTKPPEHSSPHT